MCYTRETPALVPTSTFMAGKKVSVKLLNVRVDLVILKLYLCCGSLVVT